MWSSSSLAAAAAAAATLLLALPLTVSASPLGSASDCSSRPDGFYALGCASDFLGCSGGRALPMTCSADLVYDETRQLCEYPGNVVACGGVAPEEGSGIEEGSGSGDGSGDGVDGSGEGSGVEGSGEEIEDISDKCVDRADGFYRLAACGESFLGCSGGVAWRMSCPASLKYDEQNQQCDYPGNVEGCEEAEGSGEIEGSGIEGSGTEEGSGEGIDGSGEGIDGSGEGVDGSGEGSGVEGSGEEIEDISDKCVDRADGFYRLAACGESFLGCSGGVAWRMSCPASLKYDEQNQICDYPGNVKGCEETEGSGEGSGTEGSGTEGSGTEGSGIYDTTEPVVSDDGVAIDTAAEKHIEIEDAIIDDSNNGEVIEEQKVEEEVKEIKTEDDIIDESNSDEVVEGEEQKVEEEDVKEIDAEDVIVTKDGKVVEDAEVKEIEAEDDIIDVNVEEEKPEEKQEQEVADDAEEPIESSSSSTADAQYDDANETPSCAGRADGFYALGCSSEMLACSNGLAHIMPCPAGLVFDERNQICDHSVHVAACASRDQLLAEDDLLTSDDAVSHPEIPRTRDSEVAAATLAPTTPAGPTDAVAVDAVYPAQTATIQGPRKSRRDARCKSSDGLFALDCSTEFVSCRAGVATKLECGEREAFDERAQSCVPLARHPTCFTHALQADDVIDEDVQMTKEKDDEEDLQKPIDHSFACDFEGARAEEPCADWFRLCEGGRGIEMYCLQGHLFDETAAKCVPAGQLEHCKAQ